MHLQIEKYNILLACYLKLDEEYSILCNRARWIPNHKIGNYLTAAKQFKKYCEYSRQFSREFIENSLAYQLPSLITALDDIANKLCARAHLLLDSIKNDVRKQITPQGLTLNKDLIRLKLRKMRDFMRLSQQFIEHEQPVAIHHNHTLINIFAAQTTIDALIKHYQVYFSKIHFCQLNINLETLANDIIRTADDYIGAFEKQVAKLKQNLNVAVKETDHHKLKDALNILFMQFSELSLHTSHQLQEQLLALSPLATTSSKLIRDFALVDAYHHSAANPVNLPVPHEAIPKLQR